MRAACHPPPGETTVSSLDGELTVVSSSPGFAIWDSSIVSSLVLNRSRVGHLLRDSLSLIECLPGLNVLFGDFATVRPLRIATSWIFALRVTRKGSVSVVPLSLGFFRPVISAFSCCGSGPPGGVLWDPARRRAET